MRHTRNWQVVFVLTLAASGCGRSAPEPGWAGVIDTLSTGVIAVENPAEGVWQPGQEWTVTEDLRIGSVEGDGPDMFGRISTLAVDGAGRIWVYDSQADEIRVFDDQGGFVRTIGREGDGPGEFRSVVALAVLPSGNLWAIDPQGGRISEIDTAGVFVRSHRISGSFQRFPWVGLVDSQGHYFDVAMRVADGAEIVVEYTPEVEPVDTFDVPVYPGGKKEFVEQDGTSRTSVSIPFAGELYWRLAPGRRMWTLQTDEYMLVERTLSGDTLRTVRKTFDPIPVTREQVDTAMKSLAWFKGRVDRSQIPAVHPPAVAFLQDERGYSWVLRATGDYPLPLKQVWDVFSPEGIYQGGVSLPFDLAWFIPPVFHDGAMVGVVRDSLGVPFVVKATINRDSDVS